MTPDVEKGTISLVFNHPILKDKTTLKDLVCPIIKLKLTLDIAQLWRPVITPTPPGNGNWTLKEQNELVFINNAPFAYSTEYTISISKGSESILNESLTEEAILKFDTPTVSVVKHHPKDGLHSLSPIIFVAYDQLVDMDILVATVKFFIIVEGKPKPHCNCKFANQSEIQNDKNVKRMITEHKNGKYICAIPTKPLPRSSMVQVKIGPAVLVNNESSKLTLY